MSNSANFSQPQRQSLPGILVEFANTMRIVIRVFWPMLLFFLVKFDKINKPILFLSIAGVILIIAIVSYLRYYFFTFHIDDENGEFVIQKGVFNKTRITIQLHKIQQVNINQSLIQRFVGVYKVEIDTAGSDNKEASIGAISHNLAKILKERLINNSQFEVNKPTEAILEETPVSFIKISLLSLIKIGFTANYVKSFFLLFVFFQTILENFKQFSDSKVINGDEVSNYFDNLSFYTSIAVVIGTIIGLVLLINLFRTILKYFDFSIQKSKKAIVLSYGLFSTKNTLLNPNKVQKVKITQNYFQKKLDVTTIGVQQASSEDHKENEKDKIEVPGCTELESNQILNLLFDKLPTKGAMFLPNWRKLALNIFVLLVVPVIIAFVINLKTQFIIWQEWILYVSIFSIFAFVLIWFSYKNYKLFVSSDFIIKNDGAWDIDTNIIEPYKIQAIQTSQFFWQKSTNIGSVILSTAGGTIRFSTGNFIEIKQLINYWLYQVETSDKNWM